MVSVEEVFLALQEMSAQEVRLVSAKLSQKFPALAPPVAPISIPTHEVATSPLSVTVILTEVTGEWTEIADVIIEATGRESNDIDPLVKTVRDKGTHIAFVLTANRADYLISRIRFLGGKAGKQ